MLPELSELLQFQHKHVLIAYAKNYEVSIDKAEILFMDMLRYLWLSRKHALDKMNQPHDLSLSFPLVMHEEMRAIDNMWHNFILYTHDYMTFCETYFGEYLHHIPDISEKLESTPEQFASDLNLYLNYVYDQLGEDTVKRWFAPYFDVAA